MLPRINIFVMIASGLLFIVILELIRRGRLREEYSLIWLIGAPAIFIIAAFRGTVDLLGRLLEVAYPPSLFFLVVILFLTIIQLLQTNSLSRLENNNRILTQKIASLELRLQQASIHIMPRMLTTIARLTAELQPEHNNHLALSNRGKYSLQNLLELAMECLGATSGSIVLLGQSQPVEAVTIYEGKEYTSKEKELDETIRHGLAGWVIENRQPALVTNTAEDKRWLKRSWDTANRCVRSAISAPIFDRGKIVGVITIVQSESRSFSVDDLALLIGITEHISLYDLFPCAPNNTRAVVEAQSAIIY